MRKPRRPPPGLPETEPATDPQATEPAHRGRLRPSRSKSTARNQKLDPVSRSSNRAPGSSPEVEADDPEARANTQQASDQQPADPKAADPKAAGQKTGDPEARARQICLRLLTVAPRTSAQLAQAMHRGGVP